MIILLMLFVNKKRLVPIKHLLLTIIIGYWDCLLKIAFSKQEKNSSRYVIILITLLITLRIQHAGMPFLSVFVDRADGSNPTAPVKRKALKIKCYNP